MNKLENEYKNLVSKDIPDLWDRIEAGLEEKTPVVEKKDFVVEEKTSVAGDDINVVDFSDKKKKINVGKIIKYSSFAAAACLFIVAIPLFLNNVGTKNEAPAAMDSMCAPAAAEEYHEEAAMADEAQDNSLNSITITENKVDSDNKGIGYTFESEPKEETNAESEMEGENVALYTVDVKVVDIEPSLVVEVVSAEKTESYTDETDDGIAVGNTIVLQDDYNLLGDLKPETEINVQILVNILEDGSIKYVVVDA